MTCLLLIYASLTQGFEDRSVKYCFPNFLTILWRKACSPSNVWPQPKLKKMKIPPLGKDLDRRSKDTPSARRASLSDANLRGESRLDECWRAFIAVTDSSRHCCFGTKWNTLSRWPWPHAFMILIIYLTLCWFCTICYSSKNNNHFLRQRTIAWGANNRVALCGRIDMGAFVEGDDSGQAAASWKFAFLPQEAASENLTTPWRNMFTCTPVILYLKV